MLIGGDRKRPELPVEEEEEEEKGHEALLNLALKAAAAFRPTRTGGLSLRRRRLQTFAFLPEWRRSVMSDPIPLCAARRVLLHMAAS